MTKSLRSGSKKKKLTSPSPVSGANPKGRLDFQELERLLEVMSKHSVAEIEWANEDVTLHVRKDSAGGGGHFVHHPGAMVSASVQHPVAAPVVSPAAPKAAAVNERQKQILSPFVGTFYRSSSPQAKAYVEVGHSLRRGQVLCIIEAMKLMNEIECEFEGKLIEILAENGQPVEFGEPLFLIET